MNKTTIGAVIRIIVIPLAVFFLILVGGTASLVFAIKSIQTIEQLVDLGANVITFTAYFFASLIFSWNLIQFLSRLKNP